MSILNSGFLQKISDFTKRWDSGKAFGARTTTGYSRTLKTGKYNYCVFQVTGSHAGLNLEVRGGLENETGYVVYRSIDGVKKSGGVSENGTYIIDLTRYTDLRWRIQAITSGDVTVTYNLKDHLPFQLLQTLIDKQKESEIENYVYNATLNAQIEEKILDTTDEVVLDGFQMVVPKDSRVEFRLVIYDSEGAGSSYTLLSSAGEATLGNNSVVQIITWLPVGFKTYDPRIENYNDNSVNVLRLQKEMRFPYGARIDVRNQSSTTNHTISISMQTRRFYS